MMANCSSSLLCRCVLAALATTALAASAPAITPPSAAAADDPVPGLDEIIDRNASARGGLDAWHRVATLTERGRIEHGQIKGPRSRHGSPGGGSHSADQALPFTLQFKRPHKMRLEMDLGDIKALQLFNGSTGWTMQPSAKGPVVHEFSPGEAAAAAEQVDPEGPLLDAKAKGTVLAFDGAEVVEGYRTYKLKLTLKNGAERHVWVDAQTYLELKIDGTQVIEGRLWPTATYFYDWKSVKTATGFLKLAGRVETAIGEFRTTSRIVVDQVLLNLPLDDGLFSLPAPAGPPPASAPIAPGPTAPSGSP